MTTDNFASITKKHRHLLLAANFSAYLLVTMGGIVCAVRPPLSDILFAFAMPILIMLMMAGLPAETS